MCELFGFTARSKAGINKWLKIFFSHSNEHQNGWGLALLDENAFSVGKEPKKALESLYLKNFLSGNIKTAKCIAHIRKATIGDVNEKNTHPFSVCDKFGRRWTLAHNGTIFDSEALAPFQYTQNGTTDSERILLYIVDCINKLDKDNSDLRIKTVDKAVKTIVPGNKVNLLIYDGEFLYVHKNEQGTLFEKNIDGGVMFATVPLDADGWQEFEQNRLMVYKNGKLVYAADRHDNSYIHNEEKMKLLYLAYSGL